MALRAKWPQPVRDLPPERGARPGQIRPYPAPNDNPPFRWRPRPQPGFGKKPIPRPYLPPPGGALRPLPRFLPGVGIGLGAADFLDAWFDPSRNPRPFVPPGYWVFRCAHSSGRLPGNPPYTPNGPNMGPYLELFTGQICNTSSGQVPSSANAPLTAYTPLSIGSTTHDTLILSDGGLQSGSALRMRHDVNWNYIEPGLPAPYEAVWRPATWPGMGPLPSAMPGAAPSDPNPNRWAPPSPQAPPDVPPLEVPIDPPEWQWSSSPVGEPLPRWHASQPPPPNTQEKKAISKAAKIGITLWRMMDTISELTEIGGAIYKALPAEIRAKANCGKGINIGQYGSDLNSCMVKTLVANWDKLDTAAAVREIAKNIVEDMTIGQFHKWMSKISPPGFSLQKTAITSALAQAQPEKYIAKRLRELFDFLGV